MVKSSPSSIHYKESPTACTAKCAMNWRSPDDKQTYKKEVLLYIHILQDRYTPEYSNFEFPTNSSSMNFLHTTESKVLAGTKNLKKW